MKSGTPPFFFFVINSNKHLTLAAAWAIICIFKQIDEEEGLGDKRIYYSRFNHDMVNPRRNVESVVFEFIGAGHTECLVDGDLLCAFERVHTAIHGEHSLYEMFVRRFRGKMSANDRYYGIRNMLAHNGIKLKENFHEVDRFCTMPRRIRA